MARGPASRRAARGGEGIPAPRQARARVTVGLGAVALAASTGAWLTFSVEETLRSATLLLLAPALVALAAGLAFRRPIGIPIAIFFLGGAYALRLLAEEDTLDQRAPLVAATFFLIAELSYWGLELREAVAEEAGAYLRRIGLLAGMTLGVLVLGIALLALVDAIQVDGSIVEGVGIAAAVAAVALLALSSRRTAP